MAWVPPKTLPNLGGQPLLFLDLETRDEGLAAEAGAGWPWRGGEVVGVAIGTLDREWYFPVRHAGGGNVDPDAVFAWLRDTARERRRWVFHNGLYDLGWSTTEGVEFHPDAEMDDTIAGAALLNEYRASYSLDACAHSAGIPGKRPELLLAAADRLGLFAAEEARTRKALTPEERVRLARANLWRYHSRDVGPYAEGDIAATRDLWRWQAPRLEEQNLGALYRLECDLLPMLTAMRRRGIRVDVAGAEALWQRVGERERALQKRLRFEFGATVLSPRGTKAIAQACDRLGIVYPRTKAGRGSFTKAWMEAHPHPFFATLREWRATHTARVLGIEGGILNALHGDRVYPELNPLRRDDREAGTVTGRFSCTSPNTQQASERSDLGKEIRALYLPEEGALWHAGDVSQQEPRLTVHYAIRSSLPQAKEAAEAFAKGGAKSDWHQIVADMVGISRKLAKPINLGLAYEMGAKKLAASLGLPYDEAMAIVEKYHARVPFVRGLSKLCNAKAAERGYIVTLYGRRARFPFWEPDVHFRGKPEDRPEPVFGRAAAERTWPGVPLRRAFTYRAMNRLIQGSAADWIKLAMRDLWRAGFRNTLLQVHDEVDSSVASPEEGAEIANVIRDAVTLRCPIVVDSGTGANWRDAK